MKDEYRDEEVRRLLDSLAEPPTKDDFLEQLSWRRSQQAARRWRRRGLSAAIGASCVIAAAAVFHLPQHGPDKATAPGPVAQISLSTGHLWRPVASRAGEWTAAVEALPGGARRPVSGGSVIPSTRLGVVILARLASMPHGYVKADRLLWRDLSLVRRIAGISQYSVLAMVGRYPVEAYILVHGLPTKKTRGAVVRELRTLRVQ
jgi:hypothetical protein